MAGGGWFKRKRLKMLWYRDCHCYWCGIPTRLMPKEKQRKYYPPDMATIDHLNSRLSEHRGKLPGEQTVLACWKCNQRRSAEEVAWANQKNRLTEEIP